MKHSHTFRIKQLALAAAACGVALPVLAGDIAVYTAPAQDAALTLDYASARAMPLPQRPSAPVIPSFTDNSVQWDGPPGFEPGRPGNGNTSPVTLPQGQPGVEAQEYGIDLGLGFGAVPYTTTRLNLKGVKLNRIYPFRAAGRLIFQTPQGLALCSGSLIKPGVVVTAAHCVSEFGSGGFYTNFQFAPGYHDGDAPYGVWNVSKVFAKQSYLDGTDSCAVPGIVCKNDVAVLLLTPQSSAYPGTSSGFLAYGYNGYGFTPNGAAHFTQLGYPASHDGGQMMQRTDSIAVVDSASSNNSVWGSRQTGGSSGGPEVVNLGMKSVLSQGVALGNESKFNTVVGVTSWGFTDQSVKIQGASPFTQTNVKSLVDAACADTPAACQ